MYKKQVRSMVAVLCCLMLLLSSFGGTVSADTQSVVDAIGLVSYRESVKTAIQAAEAAYDTLTNEEKATVTAARAEYDRLERIASGLDCVVDLNTTSVEGWGVDAGTTLALDSTGSYWVITPTTDSTQRYSIYGGSGVIPQGTEFENLEMRMTLKRTGGADNAFSIDIKNEAGQAASGSNWYNEIGAADGAWTTWIKSLSEFQNPGDWSCWSADTWDITSALTQFVLAQYPSSAHPTKVEINGWGLHDNSIDTAALANAANAVVDQIAGLTSASNEASVAAAREAYNALNDTQKKLVVNEAVLTDLESSLATPADVIAAIDAIGLVSYRESVKTAIEEAERLQNLLTEAQKAEVTNAQVLTAARAEYDRLNRVAEGLKIVWQVDVATNEGISNDGSELTVEETDDENGIHWIISPTGNWSVWGGIELDISSLDFDNLKLVIRLRRNGGEDSCISFDVRNGEDQRLFGSRWYEPMGAADGEWTEFEIPFNTMENGQAGIDPWPAWTAEDWNSDLPIIMFRIAQENGVPTPDSLEIAKFAIVDANADVDALVEETNGVIDAIEAIGEVTSIEQEAAINAARDAYDALTIIQQELVVNADKLQPMEIAVRRYKTAANVVTAIENIGEVTQENYAQKADAIAGAREAYDAYYNKYNDETLIPNLAALTAAEEAYNGFLAAAKEKDITALKELIAAIGEVTKDNSAEALVQIEAAEEARDALAGKYGTEILNEIDNLESLTAARAKYEELNPAYTPGDINGDGDVNASDALIALQHSVQLVTLDGSKLAAADTNRDGQVNAADALLILQYSVQIITEFPAA